MQHSASLFFKDGRVYKDNVWEYFFEQPANVTLKDLDENSLIIMKDRKDILPYYNSAPSIYTDIKKYKEYFLKHYKTFELIKFNKETQEYLDEIYSKTIGTETEVLGIILRGTDYTSLRPPLHKIQPDIKDVIKKAKELYKRFHYKKIWVSTEDEDVYQIFKKEFSNILIDNFQYKYKSRKNLGIAEYPHEDRKEHYYNLSREYLTSMYILSKCKYLIGGWCGGTLGVFNLSRGFDNQSYVYLWNIGTYGDIIKPTYNNKFERLFSVKNEYIEENKFKRVTLCGVKFKFKAGKIKNRCKEYINI